MSEPTMIADPIPDGSITETEFAADPLENFAFLFRKRSDGDQSITDDMLSEAFEKTIPGLPEGSVKIVVGDQPIEEYSVSNPSPEFLRICSDDSIEKFHNESGLAIIRENDPNHPEAMFLAIGPAYTDLASSDDYAFGDTVNEAFRYYLEGMKKRTRKAVIETFIRADKALESAKKIYGHYDDAVANLSRIMKIGDHFQDDEGIVYQLTPQEWVKVKVKPVIVNRTRREGERTGDLSMTSARDLGYEVEGKFPDALLEKFPNVDKLLKKGIETEEQNNVGLEYARQLIMNQYRTRAEDSLLNQLTKAIETFEDIAYPEIGQPSKLQNLLAGFDPEIGKTTTEKSPTSLAMGDPVCGYDPNDPDQKGIPANDAKIPGSDLPLRDMSDPSESTYIPNRPEAVRSDKETETISSDQVGQLEDVIPKTEFDKEFDAVEAKTEKEPFSTAADER